MMFTKSRYWIALLKSTYLALDDEAIVIRRSSPSTSRRSLRRSVKFFVSLGDDEIPPEELVGYSQSRSIPANPYCSTAARQFLQKFFLWVSSAAISLKLPAPQPPIESIILRSGFLSLRATIFLSLLGVLISRVSKSFLICAKA